MYRVYLGIVSRERLLLMVEFADNTRGRLIELPRAMADELEVASSDHVHGYRVATQPRLSGRQSLVRRAALRAYSAPRTQSRSVTAAR